MLVTWKQNLKHLSVHEYNLLKELCRLSRNIYNESLYNTRQYYFKTKRLLRYESNYHLVQPGETYKLLGSNAGQQTMMIVEANFKSFLALTKLAEQNKYSRPVSMPRYLDKDKLFRIHIQSPIVKEDGTITLPISYKMQRITRTKIVLHIPPQLQGKKIHQVHLIPKYNGVWFEVRYYYETEDVSQVTLDSTKALGIDLGVDNFATCATSDGNSFIIDGRKIKSINQWYNKENARLSSIKDKQGLNKTRQQCLRAGKRSRRIQDFVYCIAKYIVQYCVERRIGNLVVGITDDFQRNVTMSKVCKQNFTTLPYGKFLDRLEYLCSVTGINCLKQEESYTSKASFFDNDEMPIWNPLNPKQGSFSGKRIKRGLYQRSNGQILNADVNGALNILRKSKLNQIKHLEQCRGEVVTPLRIRLFGIGLKSNLLKKEY